MSSQSENKARAVLAKLESQRMQRRILPSDIQEKVDSENRRRTWLKYLLAVLLGIFALVVASIIDAQTEPVPTAEVKSEPEQAVGNFIGDKPEDEFTRRFEATLGAQLGPTIAAARQTAAAQQQPTAEPTTIWQQTTPVQLAPIRTATATLSGWSDAPVIQNDNHDWELALGERAKYEATYGATLAADLPLSCAIWGHTTFDNDPWTVNEEYHEWFKAHCITGSWKNPINLATASAEAQATRVSIHQTKVWGDWEWSATYAAQLCAAHNREHCTVPPTPGSCGHNPDPRIGHDCGIGHHFATPMPRPQIVVGPAPIAPADRREILRQGRQENNRDDDDDEQDDQEDLDRRIREGSARGRDVDKEKDEYRRRFGNPCRWVNGRVVCIH